MTEEKKNSKIISCDDVVVAEHHTGVVVGKVQARIDKGNDDPRYHIGTVSGYFLEIFHSEILWDDKEILQSINDRRRYLQRRA